MHGIAATLAVILFAKHTKLKMYNVAQRTLRVNLCFFTEIALLVKKIEILKLQVEAVQMQVDVQQRETENGYRASLLSNF